MYYQTFIRVAKRLGMTLPDYAAAQVRFDNIWKPVQDECNSDDLVGHFGRDSAKQLQALFGSVERAVRETFFIAVRVPEHTSSSNSRSKAGRPPNNTGPQPAYFAMLPPRCFRAPHGEGAAILRWANPTSQPVVNQEALAAWNVFIAEGLRKEYFDNSMYATTWAKLPNATVSAC